MLDIYKSLGADGYSFEPLVGFGANCALGHHGPDNTVLKRGDTVLFDVGCRKDGYCADMTRTFFYKKYRLRSTALFMRPSAAQMLPQKQF